MAKRRYRNTEKRIAKLRKEGRGTGHGRSYVPWIKIHDFSSKGRVHRCISAKSGRVVHLMSDGESDLFLQLDSSLLVMDVREQFPLERFETIRIAEELGVRHPTADGTDVVMTTDFLVSLRGGSAKAIAVKTAGDLHNRRVRQKLDIERVYWERKGVPWQLYVPPSLDRGLRLDLQQVAEWRAVDDLVDDRAEWDRRASAMLVELSGAWESRLVDVCLRAERIYGWEPGVGIAACKRLMALGLVRLSEGCRFDPQQSVFQLELTEMVG